MPAVRSFSLEYLRKLHDTIVPSVVQLSVVANVNVRVADEKPILLGTGLVLSRTSKHIGIITSMSCDQGDGYRVVARFGDRKKLQAEVVAQSGLLYGLVVRGHDLKAIPCTAASFHEGSIMRSAPVFSVGCSGVNKDKIIVSGLISVGDFEKWVRQNEVQTFVHSCPIGDGLMGAPIFNTYGEVVGMNVARTPKTSSINFALKVDELRETLESLVGAKTEIPIPQILKLFSEQILDFESKKEKDGTKRKAEAEGSAGGGGQAEGSRRRYTSAADRSRRQGANS